MTELETMERAKLYLDKQANGIDPLTDLPVAEGDVVNQMRILRCLFFVSDVLRRVIENGGISPVKTVQKSAFTIDAGDLARVEYSVRPIGINDLCQRITVAAGEKNEKSLSSSYILNWLEEIEMLVKTKDAEGKNRRRPTPEGNRMGIIEEIRQGIHGDYLAVLYNETAQRFIVGNLQGVLSARNQ